jgi:hypothetical protein
MQLMALPRGVIKTTQVGRSAVEAARVRRSPKASKSDWRAVLVPGHIEMTRPAFLFYDKAKEQVLVSQFGRPKKPNQWWIINPFPAASKISSIPMSQLVAAKRSGRMSGTIGNEA